MALLHIDQCIYISDGIFVSFLRESRESARTWTDKRGAESPKRGWVITRRHQPKLK